MAAIYDFEVKTIDGAKSTLKPYQGKVMLIVNVASACGLTPQYKGLQELYNEYHDKGLEILGFPCNQFGAQEPGTESEIKDFCSTRFDVSFPMFSKVEVNGDNAHPLYQYLKKEKVGKEGKADIEWNFAKFLVDDKGRVVERFSARTEPSEIKGRIAELLKH
ncbi:MAG TPA: glutathione peroxidase [Oligoflexus sp.]|uniref:glutathione peroxidase n=1 Tax=Oligoflexus sp. TaxID=1971216 RepID=UPI002D4ADF19|nr:glutathione peroxidase [Oligoflexus sp.]HYX38779.1 glutathione peroxidase [Oligoflexus sp.]